MRRNLLSVAEPESNRGGLHAESAASLSEHVGEDGATSREMAWRLPDSRDQTSRILTSPTANPMWL